MKDLSIRRNVIIALCCIAVMAVFSCKPEPDPVTTYSVTYDANGAEGLTPPKDKHSYESGDEATVLDFPNGFVKDGTVYACSWDTLPDATGTTYYPGDVIEVKQDITLYARWTGRKFSAADMQTGYYYTTVGELRATGDHCVIYTEGTAKVSDDVVQTVMTEFDDSIYPKITGVFGTPYDVGVKDKTLLLLLDIKDGFNGSGGYVAGYFAPNMMLAKSSTNPYSNEEDMLFLDTNPATPSSLAFRETAAHEFQHLINFSQHGIGTTSENATQQEVWLNEGLSAAAEYIYSGTESSDWVNYFNAGAGALIYGNNFFVWDGSWETDDPNNVLDDYATAYLFFRWLGIQAGSGIGALNVPDNTIYKAIITSTKTDCNAVLDAVAADLQASDVAHGSWGVLLRSWLLANYFHKATDDPWGYNGAVAITKAPIYTELTAETPVSFSSGEAMFYPITSDYTPHLGSGDDILYCSMDPANPSIIQVLPPFDDDHMLVMNGNPDIKAADQSGFVYVASMARANYLRSVETVPKVEYEWPKMWAIDADMTGTGASRELTGRALEASRAKARAKPSLRKAN